MYKPVDEILEESDDFSLCDGVFSSFPGNEIQVEKYTEAERIVTLVWHATGIIENGGFHYLLEGTFPGDSNFYWTAEAFKSIGAQKAYSAFTDLMQNFPQGLSSNLKKRTKLYEWIPESERQRIDNLFWENLDSIPNLLANYIRTHKEQLKKVLTNA